MIAERSDREKDRIFFIATITNFAKKTEWDLK